MNNSEGRTKILVTHALHFLPQVDYIYTIFDGQIVERGAYVELMDNGSVFSKYVKEFGSKQEEERDTDLIEEEKKGDGQKSPGVAAAPREVFEEGRTMMQEEERNIGAVTWRVYKTYLSAGNGYILVPVLLFWLSLVQGTRVMSSYWLVFWQERQFHQPVGFYVRDAPLLFLQLLILMCFVRWAFMPPWESP